MIELLIVVAIIGILAAIAVPNFMNARTRAQVAKANGDMDALAKAASLFYLDQNRYPEGTDNIGETIVSGKVDPLDADEFFTFQIHRAGQFVEHLTSPVAYMSSAPIDPFSHNPGLPYGYAGGKKGYITTSFGPDRDQHEGVNDFAHRGDIDEPSAYLREPGEKTSESLMQSIQGVSGRHSSPERLRFYLLPRTYDPSNGVNSNGDIWRSNI